MVEAGLVVIGLLLIAGVVLLAVLLKRVGPPDLTVIANRLDTVDRSQERVERSTRKNS